MQNRIFRAHLSVLLVQVIYAANFSIAKLIVPSYIQPYGIIVLRVLPSAVLFFAASLVMKGERILSGDKYRLILCSLSGVVINQLLFFKGLSLTAPVNGAIIMTTNPILVMLLAAVILKEKITPLKISGILIGMTGAIGLIVFQNKFSPGEGSATGDLLIFINSISFAVFLIIVKPLFKRYHPVTITKWIFFFGSFMVLPFGFSDVEQVQWNTFTPVAWFSLAFVVLAVTFVAYLLNIFALRTLSPSTVSSYIYFQPVVATMISLWMGFGKPGFIHLAAVLLIFAGVYLVNRNPAGKEKSAE